MDGREQYAHDDQDFLCDPTVEFNSHAEAGRKVWRGVCARIEKTFEKMP